jgi:hypothetical protein
MLDSLTRVADNNRRLTPIPFIAGGQVNKQKLIIVAILAFVALSCATTGYAYVRWTIESNANACGQLPGFAGMLQKMNFVPVGSCQVKQNGQCTSAGTACYTKGAPTSAPANGTCKTQGNTCQCVANK